MPVQCLFLTLFQTQCTVLLFFLYISFTGYIVLFLDKPPVKVLMCDFTAIISDKLYNKKYIYLSQFLMFSYDFVYNIPQLIIALSCGHSLVFNFHVQMSCQRKVVQCIFMETIRFLDYILCPVYVLSSHCIREH